MPRYAMVVFGLVMLTIGIGAVVAAVVLGLNEGRYESDGREIDGTVVGTRIDSSGDDTEYEVTYRFTPPGGGREFVATHDIDRDDWERLAEGDPIRIEYVPDEPQLNRPAGTGGWVGPIIAGTLGGLLAPAGGGLVALGIRRVLRHRELLREGVLTEGTVIGAEMTSYRVNRRRQWIIVYRYTDRLGGEHIGRSDHMPMDRATAWQPGMTAPVRYAAENPAESVWVPR